MQRDGQMDLLSYRSPSPGRYPERAGFKEGTTSKAAADRIEARGDKHKQYSRIIDTLRQHGPMGPDRCAKILGLSILYARPRFSELSQAVIDRQGIMVRPPLIRETGAREDTESGNPQRVYELVGI